MDSSGVIAVGGNAAARPRMLICYLCGREYGTRSLPIHIPQCQKKWLAEEQRKPKNERRSLPEAPPLEAPIASTSGSYNIDAFNDAAYAQFEGTLVACPFCERRFKPDAFRHHQKSCTVDNPAKKAGTGLTASSLSNRLQPGLISGTQRSASSAKQLALAKVELMSSTSSSGTASSKSILATGTSVSGSREHCSACGVPYAVPDAKFCSECGTRRSATK